MSGASGKVPAAIHCTPEAAAGGLARDLRDGDVVRVGVAMPVAEAAVRLAHLLHGPNMELIFSGVQMNAADLDVFPMPQYGWDRRALVGVESYSDTGHRFDRMKDWHRHVFFVGGLQLDQRGNLNLFGIPDGDGGWKMRGPGSIALATMSAHCAGYYIVMPSHSPRTFVERVALISALGDRTERARLKLPGGGIRLVLSPLGVFDFDDAGDMRVRSLHEGVSLSDAQAATGFELVAPDEVPVTPPPTADELALLRERVDVHGTLA